MAQPEQYAASPAGEARSLAEAYGYCRRITQRSSSNFYYAFRLLPRERHNALCAFYAFCRFVDDIADQPDEGQPHGQKERIAQLLNTWREELDRCYTAQPRHPISQALADAVRRFPIRQEDLSGIIDGVEMDLSRTRYQTFSELYEYCYRVASLVGLVCIEIFGYQALQTREYAINLGVAFQLTNILRDVGEDAQRARIYLPLEDLARFGYSEQELLGGVYNEPFFRLMTFEGERAQDYYRRAEERLDARCYHVLVGNWRLRVLTQHWLPSRCKAAHDLKTVSRIPGRDDPSSPSLEQYKICDWESFGDGGPKRTIYPMLFGMSSR